MFRVVYHKIMLQSKFFVAILPAMKFKLFDDMLLAMIISRQFRCPQVKIAISVQIHQRSMEVDVCNTEQFHYDCLEWLCHLPLHSIN